MKLSLCGGKAFRHQRNHENIGERYAGLDGLLVVFAVPSVIRKPGENSFHDPAFQKNHELLDANGSKDGLKNSTERVFGPVG